MKLFDKRATRRIYLDYASLTPIDPRVLRVMKKYSSSAYANPSSWYREGVAAKKAMNEARKIVADFIHAHDDEIIFTSGGTEANSIALQGVVAAFSINGQNKDLRPHIIISAIEHSSIMETARILEKRGCEVTKIPVDKNGVIILDELKKAIKPNTVLVSIMTVNNELGTIQPIREIAKTIRQARVKFSSNDERNIYPLFHTDSAQAGLYQDLNIEQLGVDLMTLDGGKVYGPRGIGALFVKRNLMKAAGEDQPLISPIMFGGGQENGLRSGTENLPAIVGFAEALRIIGEHDGKDRGKETAHIAELRKIFIDGLKAIRSDVVVNGDGQSSSPHILNISIPSIDNEFLVMQLDAAGIALSTKSSCLRDEDESYVLRAVGANSKTSLRFSFGRWTKRGDIKKVLKTMERLLSDPS